MRSDIIKLFYLQRQIFGICPNSGEFFRLSDCKIYLKKRKAHDWMDKLELQEQALEAKEYLLEEKKEELQEKGREKGRRLAQKMIKKSIPFSAHGNSILMMRRLYSIPSTILYFTG